jgi:hypothetical protein
MCCIDLCSMNVSLNNESGSGSRPVFLMTKKINIFGTVEKPAFQREHLAFHLKEKILLAMANYVQLDPGPVLPTQTVP